MYRVISSGILHKPKGDEDIKNWDSTGIVDFHKVNSTSVPPVDFLVSYAHRLGKDWSVRMQYDQHYYWGSEKRMRPCSVLVLDWTSIYPGGEGPASPGSLCITLSNIKAPADQSIHRKVVAKLCGIKSKGTSETAMIEVNGEQSFLKRRMSPPGQRDVLKAVTNNE